MEPITFNSGIECRPGCNTCLICRDPAQDKWRINETGSPVVVCPWQQPMLRYVQVKLPIKPSPDIIGYRSTVCAECDKMIITDGLPTCSACTRCGNRGIDGLVISYFTKTCQHPLRSEGYGWQE